ncbi:MAG: hypothetical protein ICV73_25985, partial [Acetobacteraceae bacterium]|nr:hypothetical protein [Acetobacteraceae bacterium]
MARPASPANGKGRTVYRALPVLGFALGMAVLTWGGVRAWRALPAIGVAPQAAQVAAAAPESLEEAAFRVLRGRLREPAAAAFRDVRVYRFG